MALELQLAHCDTCNGYYSSTVLNPKDLDHPEIIDHYFYHGEPWFTLDKKTFDALNQQSSNVRIVDFNEHLKDDQRYCTCAKNNKLKKDSADLSPNRHISRKIISEFIDQDIYFYDLYITSQNYHQDAATRQAI
jgi:hypothetical protein